METLKNAVENVFEFIISIFPLIIVVVFVVFLGGGMYAIAHEDAARRMYAEHDAYVLGQQICEVHNAWYTPSQNLPNLTSCRRLSDHSLFFVQNTGRELIPTLEYSNDDNHQEASLGD